MRPSKLLAHTGRMLPAVPCGTRFAKGLTQRMNAVFGPMGGNQRSAPFPLSAA